MAEIEKTPDLISGVDIGANAIDHTILADSFINVTASDPTVANDTGQGYVVGSIWVNSSSGDVFQAIDVSAESSVWVNQEGDDINNDPFQGTNYGFSIGGYGPSGGGDLKDRIDRYALSAPHNATDYGEITTAGYKYGTFTDAAKSKGFVCGGSTPPGDSPQEVTTFNFTGSPIGTTDIGDVLHERGSSFGMQCQTPSLGILGGGINYTPGGDNIIDTIQTFSNGIAPFTAADSGGELVAVNRDGSCSESPTHGYIGGGQTPSHTDNITRWQKGTSDNSVDVGELAVSSASYGGGATDGRGGNGFHISGQNTSGTEVATINKYPHSSPTSGSDVGEYTIVSGPAGKNMSGHQVSSTTHFFTQDDSGNVWKGAFAAPSTTVDVDEFTVTTSFGSATQY